MKKMPRPRSPQVSGSTAAGKPQRTSDSMASSPARNAGQAGSPLATGTRWTFLTNHSHVLILLARSPGVVLRQVAYEVGITERAVQRIIADLEEAGIIEREKIGRQNRYRLMADQPLRHSVESHRTISDLLSLMAINESP